MSLTSSFNSLISFSLANFSALRFLAASISSLFIFFLICLSWSVSPAPCRENYFLNCTPKYIPKPSVSNEISKGNPTYKGSLMEKYINFSVTIVWPLILG